MTSDDQYKTIISSIPEYSLLFSKYYILSSFLTRFFLSNYSLETQLEMWQYKIFIDDKLSPYELVSSFYKRSLYLHLNNLGKILDSQQKNSLNKSREFK
ncbi:unnamed protein product [Adineta steineri]|uniref:Uncharacterized protein n=1 Tax=Adineta steineri TaxID=433720 RepID=A0A814E729_9BILA|nr:unnamed protein product [Adineta steineri]CAF0958856.1 unnamed protein product [Adineta steineri]CAF0965568.1 unnamed protein product [Adineta steineri]